MISREQPCGKSIDPPRFSDFQWPTIHQFISATSIFRPLLGKVGVFVKAKDARRCHQGQVADVFQMLLAVKGYPKMTGNEYTKDLSIITRITTKKMPKSVSRTLTIGDVTLISRLREEKKQACYGTD